MSREKYDVLIVCPNCGQKGMLSVSENDYPFMQALDRSAICINGQFDASMIDDSGRKVTCKKCEQEFSW